MKIIVIGAGPGGYETAVEAAGRGVEVILIEEGKVGGTCLNEGCIPTKTLYRSASLFNEVKRASEFGIACGGEPTIDFAGIMERKNTVVGQLRTGVETLLNNKLITLVHGRAEIIGKNKVRVTKTGGEDGAMVDGREDCAGEGKSGCSRTVAEEYSADYIFIATGSHPVALPIAGANLAGVLNSTQILDIDHVPERLCIIGAGVIGLEFACIFNSFGSKVTVIEYCPQILPNFDSDLSKRLKQSLSKSGIEIILKAAVQNISKVREESSAAADGVCGKAETALKVEYCLKDEVLSVTSDKVLMAVGRRPNVDGIGLENVGVEFSPKGIAVDDNMRTNVPSIYAIGDVNGQCMLAHAAIYQGLRALNAVMGESDNIDLGTIPSVVFTSPEAASVGLTEERCREYGINYKVLKSFFRANGKAVSEGETDGFVKVIVATESADVALGGSEAAPTAEGGISDASSMGKKTLAESCTIGQIIGCHLFGPHASDLIAEISALIQQKATLSDLKSIIHAHPTLSEVFKNLT